MTDTRPIEHVAQAIKAFREQMLDAGFVHANETGEMVSADGTTWIGTMYVYGEYSIYAWRRPRGYGEIAEQRHVLRVRADHDTAVVQELGKRLARWAKKAPRNTAWPVKGLGPVK